MMMMNNPKPGTDFFSTETKKKFDRAALRLFMGSGFIAARCPGWITIAASTATTGFLVYYIADGAFSLMETCVATPGSIIAPVACTDPGSAPEAFGWLGALVGFWFAYTGRLARLFRKV
jgi:hypothetical protein